MASVPFEREISMKFPKKVRGAGIYTGSYEEISDIKLRIATGGAGESGLVGRLANAFINEMESKPNFEPFTVVWIKSDTAASFNHLAENAADLSITYHPRAESIALQQGIADRSEYAWRDHFMLVGPRSNPARLFAGQPATGSTIYDLFSKLFCAAVESANLKQQVRFLSRYDKSATNIKESSIWSAIGQTPWSHPYSSWYHRDVLFPFDALRTAAKLQEYTLVDRGTWYAVEEWVGEELTIIMEGGDDEGDPLLNPAHALVCSYGENKEMANLFVDWLVRADGGQEIIKSFAVNDNVLYTGAPAAEEKSEDLVDPVSLGHLANLNGLSAINLG
ncbi:hypothetical protein MMC32_002264 [Xylographa parallela]|nr:hypothetical protein [Xylographa parallela]